LRILHREVDPQARRVGLARYQVRATQDVACAEAALEGSQARRRIAACCGDGKLGARGPYQFLRYRVQLAAGRDFRRQHLFQRGTQPRILGVAREIAEIHDRHRAGI